MIWLMVLSLQTEPVTIELDRSSFPPASGRSIPQTDFSAARAAYRTYVECARSAASRFERSREEAVGVARSAVAACSAERAALEGTMPSEWSSGDRRDDLERIDRQVRTQAELRVVEIRSTRRP